MIAKSKILAVFGLLAATAATVVWACWGGNYPSVHFNSEQPDFGAPPSPLTIPSWEEIGDRPTPEVMAEADQNSPTEEELQNQQNQLASEAKAAERSNDWASAQRLWGQVFDMGLSGAASAHDHMEVDRQAESGFAAAAKKYVALRETYDAGKGDATIPGLKALYASGSAGPVRAHALYLLGAIQADRQQFTTAASTFALVASRFPKNSRSEASLIMVPRCLLRSPTQRDTTLWIDSPLPEPALVAQSKKAIQTLLKNFPVTRFRQSALGWLGRCDYVMGRYAIAMEDYLRQLNASKSSEEQVSALSSVRYTSKKLSSDQARDFGNALRKSDDLLPPYLDYRLFHTEAKAEDLKSLAALASEALQANPKTKLSAAILARLGEISYLSGDHAKAANFANRALAEPGPQGIDLAHYVRGGAAAKLKDDNKAIRDFEQLVEDFPRSYLRDSAKENLALLYEGKNEFGKALQIYFDLDYRPDAAFLLDARMSLAELRKFLDEHPSHPKTDLIRFSIGMKLLRADNFSDARAEFDKIKPEALAQLSGSNDPSQWAWVEGMDKLQNPITTATELEKLYQAAGTAKTDDEKAAALYQVANYYYDHRNLLLYNAGAWEGGRQLLGWSWDDKVATSADNEAVTLSTLEQECLNRCKEICLELAATYPKTPTAPKAIYRAACCARRLADFNTWWREYNKQQNQWRLAVELMKRVAKDYPADALAKPAVKFAKVFEDEEKDAIGGIDLLGRESCPVFVR